MAIELIYAADCPNVSKARANLAKALVASGQEARWTEWDRSDPDSPPHARGYGSPTILVDGQDVAGAPSDGSGCCRLYRGADDRLDGAPSVAQIATALHPGSTAPPIPSDRFDRLAQFSGSCAGHCLCTVAQVGLPSLPACLCGIFERYGFGLADRCGLSVSADGGVARVGYWGDGCAGLPCIVFVDQRPALEFRCDASS